MLHKSIISGEGTCLWETSHIFIILFAKKSKVTESHLLSLVCFHSLCMEVSAAAECCASLTAYVNAATVNSSHTRFIQTSDLQTSDLCLCV